MNFLAGERRVVADLKMDPPFSPWLRLAHRWSYAGDTPVRARQRVLRDCEFILQVDGDSWLFLPAIGGSVPMPAGSLTLIPPGLVHAQAPERGWHVAVHFDLHAQPALVGMDMVSVQAALHARADVSVQPQIRLRGPDRDRLMPMVVRLDDPEAWRRRFDPLLTQWALRTLDRPRERLVAAGVLAAALADWSDLSAVPATTSVAALLEDVDVCDRRIGVATLARRAGLGETAFRAAVKAATGRSPRAWLEERRFEQARRMLAETSLPISAVARACGYDDPFHFSRVCRRLTGRAPRDLRPHIDLH